MRYAGAMKTAVLPSVQVEPELLDGLESVLTEGETIADFIARGLRSRDEARRTGEYVDADIVVEGLQRKLDAARVRVEDSPK